MSEQSAEERQSAGASDDPTTGAPVESGTGPDEAALHGESTDSPDSPVLETEGDQDRFDAG